MMYEALVLNMKTKHEALERFAGFSLRQVVARLGREGWKRPGFAVWLFKDGSRKPMAYKPSYGYNFSFKMYKEKRACIS